ncbi:MAG: hypothetical protein IK025_12435 [Bacteroidales bacterium]|nr:hypothetical protein [Bacteroidales bacterium]
MNRYLSTFFVMLLLASLPLLYSCGGTSSGKANLVAMYGLVNGSNWRGADPTAIVSEHKIKVNGTSANGQTIIITLNAKELGEYTFSQTNGHYAEFIPNMASGTERYSTLTGEGSGFVRLSSLNEETSTVGGEFYFKAYRNDGTFKSITEGKFSNVPYTYYNLDEDKYNNTFAFTQGGRNWTAKDISGVKNDTAIILTGACDRSEAWQSIILQLPTNVSEGVHYFGTDVSGVFQSGFYNFPATAGAITITEYNSDTKIIKGSFFFNYRDNNSDVQSISDGAFDVKYNDLTVINK